jgi:hypothetical protein
MAGDGNEMWVERYHSRGLNNSHLFLTVLNSESWTSGYQHGEAAGRTPFYPADCL